MKMKMLRRMLDIGFLVWYSFNQTISYEMRW